MAKKKTSRPSPTVREIERSIHVIRGQRVMLDADLAKLYGVPTFRLNEQVSRNRERFPEDFAYQLTQQEFTNLKSQNAISSSSHGGRRTRPWVFTEQGVAMLSSVLNSPTAVSVNIEIMRTFVRLRRLMATPGELVEQITKLAETVQLHDNDIKVISRVLQQMLGEASCPAAADRVSCARWKEIVTTCREVLRESFSSAPPIRPNRSEGDRRRQRHLVDPVSGTLSNNLSILDVDIPHPIIRIARTA